MSLIGDVARWTACGAVSAPLLTAAGVVAFVDRDRGYRLLRRWAGLAARIFDVDIALEDRNHGNYGPGPHLFVQLNQTTLAETFIMIRAMPRPFHIIINLEFALMPFIGWALWAQGNVMIVRQWPWQARRALDGVARRLVAETRPFFISVEGRRSPDGRLSPYKKGGAVLAIATQATVIPYFYRGARERLPHGEWRVRPGHVDLVVCEPISTRGMTYADRDALLEQLRQIAVREGLG